jgi:hypothetical protein
MLLPVHQGIGTITPLKTRRAVGFPPQLMLS